MLQVSHPSPIKQVASTFALKINGITYQFPIVNAYYGFTDEFHTPDSVHIFASGSSISQVNIDTLLNQPSIFVNGSIQLFKDYNFVSPVAYVISDHRFIEHNLELMELYYRAKENSKAQCPLYITQAVLEKLNKLAPHYLQEISTNIRLIYNYQKPITAKKPSFFGKIINKVTKDSTAHSKNIHIQTNTSNPTIGVSTHIGDGFVEAGTVAFVACQLAFSMGMSMQFQKIYLHGMDLLNANQPRFYENQHNQAPCKLDKAVENRIIPSFDHMAYIYQQHGITVYNGSPVSKNIFKQCMFSDEFLF